MINKWIDNGCDYQQGIELYEYYGLDEMFLEKFKQRENAFLKKKMKDDLMTVLDNINQNLQPKFDTKKIKYQSKPLEFYPIELHPVFNERINTHLEARSLKIELNKLGAGKAEKALPIILQIDKLFTRNQKCWDILKHYEETGKILPIDPSSTFKDLTPSEVVRTMQNKESSASHLKKNIRRWQKELDSYDGPRRIKKEQDLLAKKEKLQSLENDIEYLRGLIYENE